jgi:excisionase family DNA binding protein
LRKWLEEALSLLQQWEDGDVSDDAHVFELDPDALETIGLIARRATLYTHAFDLGAIGEPGRFLAPDEAIAYLSRALGLCRESPEQAPDYLSIPQAAAHANLSPSKIRREIKAGRLPAANKSSKRRPLYRIAKTELDDWMRQEGASVPPKSVLKPLVDRYFPSASKTAR